MGVTQAHSWSLVPWPHVAGLQTQTSGLPAKGIRARSECPPLFSASTNRAGMLWGLCSGTTGSHLCWMPLPLSPGPHRTNCLVLSWQSCLPRTWMTAEPRKQTHRGSVGPMLAGDCVCIGEPDPASPSSSQQAKQGLGGEGGGEGSYRGQGQGAGQRCQVMLSAEDQVQVAVKSFHCCLQRFLDLLRPVVRGKRPR